MRPFLFTFLFAPAPAPPPDWADLSWGAPLPAGLVEEHDPPWAGRPGEACGWQGELLLCADGAGGLTHAHRRIVEPVRGPERRWMRTAGLEWTSGHVEALAATSPLRVWRWGPERPPWLGWESAAWGEATPAAWGATTPAEPAAPGAEPQRAAVTLEGAEALSAQAVALITRGLSRCGGDAVHRLPLALLSDLSGEVRMVRLQARPPEGADMGCVVAAVGAPRVSPGATIELMVSLTPGAATRSPAR